MPGKHDFWFPAKTYGWGWGFPSSWQGWGVFVAYLVALDVAAIWISPVKDPISFVITAIVLSLALVAICWVKGEPPRWRWGDKGRG